MQSNNSEAIKKSNRQNLLLVFAVFALPVIVATMMYVTGWKPSATGNHGELIQPARFIEEISMQSIDAKPVKFSELHGKWTMVYFDNAACPEECVKQLYNMRQTHIAQGKDQERVQRLFIFTDAQALDTLKSKLADYPDMLVWTGEKSVLSKLIQDFGIEIKNTADQGYIYLLDPMGNLMMRYSPGVDPAGMRKDLVRLLKYSSEKH
jgi:cytochrome oxidase Cu insertion factor (SCO1/SenC/PrrC family)